MKSQAENARESVAEELREAVRNAQEKVTMWPPRTHCDRYRRERARLWRVALRAVERAK